MRGKAGWSDRPSDPVGLVFRSLGLGIAVGLALPASVRTADVVRMLKTRLTERRTAKGFAGEVDDARLNDAWHEPVQPIGATAEDWRFFGEYLNLDAATKEDVRGIVNRMIQLADQVKGLADSGGKDGDHAGAAPIADRKIE